MRSRQAPGKSATARSPDNKACSISVRKTIWAGVSYLVGLHANKAGRHPAINAPQVAGLPRSPNAAEGGARHRRNEIDERLAAARLHLKKKGLAFVQRHAARFAHRLTAPILRQPAFVERVAGLVHHRHERLRKVAIAITGRDANIVGHAGGERMVADIQSAVVGIETDADHQIFAELALGVDGDISGKRERRRLGGLPRLHAFANVRQHRGEVGKNGFDKGGGEARIVNIEKRIVRRDTERLCLGVRLLAHKRHYFVKERRDGLEIVGWTRLSPGHLARRRRLRQRLNEIARNGVCVAPATAHLAQVRGLPVVKIAGRGLCRVQQVRERRIGDEVVAENAECRELLAARLGATRRHHHRPIPLQDSFGPAQIGKPAKSFLEVLIRRHCAALLPGGPALTANLREIRLPAAGGR